MLVIPLLLQYYCKQRSFVEVEPTLILYISLRFYAVSSTTPSSFMAFIFFLVSLRSSPTSFRFFFVASIPFCLPLYVMLRVLSIISMFSGILGSS